MKSLLYPKVWINTLIELCIAALIIVMPIHNVILQFVTNIIGGGAAVAGWKDVLLVILVASCGYQIISIMYQLSTRTEGQLSKLQHIFKSDSQHTQLAQSYIIALIFGGIGIFLILGFGLSAWINQTQMSAIIFGFYFEIWWVLVIVALLMWVRLMHLFANTPEFVVKSPKPKARAKIKITSLKQSAIQDTISPISSYFETHTKVFLRRFGQRIPVYVAVGFLLPLIVSLFIMNFGQVEVLERLGYQEQALSDGGLVSNSELCHPIDMGVDVCRLSSTFSHPLHFVTYLVLIIPFVFVFLITYKGTTAEKYIWLIVLLISILAILTFSRFVIFGWVLFAVVALVLRFVAPWVNTHKDSFKFNFEQPIQKVYSLVVNGLIIAIIGGGLSFVYLTGVGVVSDSPILNILPEAIRKPNSTDLHYRHMRVRGLLVQDERVYGVGYGPGTVGSAARTKYQDFQQNSIYLDITNPYNKNYIPIWTQMLTENWIVQIWVNYGATFALVYISFLIWIMRDLKYIFGFKLNRNQMIRVMLAIGLLTVFGGNILEHLYESQITVWYVAVTALMIELLDLNDVEF